MQQRIENAAYEALEARRRADECMDTHLREKWLRVAGAWEGVISTFENIQMLRDAALAAEIVLAAKGAQTLPDPLH